MPTSTTDDAFASPWTNRSTLWVLNPGLNIDQCFDYGIENYVFTQRTYQFKRNMAIDPKKQLDFYSRGRPWRALLVEYDGRVSLLFDSKHGWNKPVAAYPSWSYKDHTSARLADLCRNYPLTGQVVGKFWGDEKQYKAVRGQDRVILIRNPPVDKFDWQTMMGYLSDLKRVHPEIQFHMHGGKSVQRTIGISIDRCDHPVTLQWTDGRPTLLLPNGAYSRGQHEHNHWGRLIGEQLSEFRRMKDRRELSRYSYKFNLKALIWAERNQDRLYAFQGKRPDVDPEAVDWVASDVEWKPTLSRYRPRVIELGDKWLCDTCTISNRCPYSRHGAVCIVDGTEGAKLSEQFRSRKSSDIIDGISSLLGASAERYENALATEQDMAAQTGIYKLSPAVTALANGLFDRAIQMARLLDPQIAGQMANGRVNVGIVNANAGAVAAATPQEIMAGVAAQLQAHGIALENASIGDIEAILRGDKPPGAKAAIEAVAYDSDEDD
jgi:hypothetical protein